MSHGLLSFEYEESSGTIFRQVTLVPKFSTDSYRNRADETRLTSPHIACVYTEIRHSKHCYHALVAGP